MWETASNPYVDANWLENQFIEAMKAQERTAILAVLNAKELLISSEGASLTGKLDQKAEEMEEFSSGQMVSNLEEGLQGQAAEAANTSLKNIKKPSLKSPVKGG